VKSFFRPGSQSDTAELTIISTLKFGVLAMKAITGNAAVVKNFGFTAEPRKKFVGVA